MPRLPSFGIKRRLRRWAIGVLDRLTEPTAILAKLYARDRSEPREPIGSRGALAAETLSEDGGLPLPPLGLTMAWNRDLREYVSSGKQHAETILALAARHGMILDEGSTVLDWGCGTGRVLRHFADKAAVSEFWGVDVDEPSIRWAKHHLSPPFRFVNVSHFPYLPFPDESASLIYGISVMTHLEHFRDMWVMEFRRLLRPGGMVVLTIHDEKTIQHIRDCSPPGTMGLPKDLSALVDFDAEVVHGDRWNTTFTFLSSKHVRREWGRYLDVVEICPTSVGFQSAVILRKEKPSPV
jgi:ubiquinone/menaquinone biosynthesis C-methylase UbiE